MIFSSYLRETYFSQRLGHITLNQSKITDWQEYPDFKAFCEGFTTFAVYPAPSSQKFETYGWTPTLFAHGLDANGNETHQRKSSAVADHLTLFVADLDNHQANHSKIEFSDLQARLTSRGLNHLLYTSFSHKPDHHKVRIVIPVSRWITVDEAFKIFTVFNHDLNYQLDGSIYDPADYLYGPHIGSLTAIETGLSPLDVEAFLEAADALPDEAKTMVKRHSNHGQALTEADILKANAMAATITTSSDDISIHNPKYFNPEWIKLLHQSYLEGSKSRTVRGLIAKAWVKSKGTLTRGDLWILYVQLDQQIQSYCQRTYGRAACERDIISAMTATAQN